MGGTGVILLWVAVLGGMAWLLFIRPQRRARERARVLQQTLVPGEEVATIGGILGTIEAVEGDEVRLEIAPDVVIRVASRAIAGRVGPPADEAYVEDGEGDEDEEYEDDAEDDEPGDEADEHAREGEHAAGRGEAAERRAPEDLA